MITVKQFLLMIRITNYTGDVNKLKDHIATTAYYWKDYTDIFYVQGGEEKMIDFDFLQLAGKIDGKQYLEELEEIYFGRPDIDCEEIVRRFRLKADTFCR